MELIRSLNSLSFSFIMTFWYFAKIEEVSNRKLEASLAILVYDENNVFLLWPCVLTIKIGVTTNDETRPQ